MADTQPAGTSCGAGFDLSQFYQVFFEEAGENLEQMEQMLLELDVDAADDESLNAIFRCAHSVKGGAATFGFADVAELTHEMETLLDRLRRHELAPTAEMVDVLLQSGDALKAQLARHQGLGGAALDTRELLAAIRALVDGRPRAAVPAASAAPAQTATAPASALRSLELTVGPLPRTEVADELAELFRDMPDLGTIEPLDAGQAADGMRRYKVLTASADDELLDLFSFHVGREQIRLAPLGPGYGFHPGAPGAPHAQAAPADPGYGFFDDAPGAPSGDAADAAAPAPAVETPAPAPRPAPRAEPRTTSAVESSTLRVSVEKVDQLINLVGELVTQGEATELDKGLVEKITDPLTHLVRNSCDHGIETPAERLAKGKAEHGTITLVASHQGGSIVIEVRDDGKGLNRAKLLAKARERGLDAPDSLADADVWNLIFAPGFSTAEQVTDVSGRGVGMDVVKKNITALGGTVEIDSAEGYGMSVRVRLPLTLAIMDGMSVGVGDECYILPLASVVESFQVRAGMIRTLGASGRVVQVRDEYLPVIDLERAFNVPRFDFERSSEIMVVVEAEGGRVALLVDELLGQQQVVVKNLEANYRKVPDVSGATILGDGRVALILDVGSLVRRTRH